MTTIVSPNRRWVVLARRDGDWTVARQDLTEQDPEVFDWFRAAFVRAEALNNEEETR